MFTKIIDTLVANVYDSSSAATSSHSDTVTKSLWDDFVASFCGNQPQSVKLATLDLYAFAFSKKFELGIGRSYLSYNTCSKLVLCLLL